ELRLYNIIDTLLNHPPACSKATIVFGKLASSSLLAILSISRLCCRNASSNAGQKCSSFILSKGGTSNGVLYAPIKGLSVKSLFSSWLQPTHIDATIKKRIKCFFCI